MIRRPLRPAALACTLVAAAGLAVSGCGAGADKDVAREGLFVELGGVTYNVYITRQLNLRDPEDRDYATLPEAPRGTAYYGVFLNVCNDVGPPVPSAAEFKIVDTQGNEYFPLKLERDNFFAYEPKVVGAKKCIPEAGSIAADAPAGGSLLIFLLSTQATENRPLELEIAEPIEGTAPAELENVQPPPTPASTRAPQTASEPATGGLGAGQSGPAGGKRPTEPQGDREHIRIELDI
jgi:hypothetical protein